MDAAEVLAQLRADSGLREMARALLLSDELLRLPESMARLAEGQVALERQVSRLAEGQVALERQVSRLAEGQAALERQVSRLAEGQAALERQVSRLAEGQAALQESHSRLWDSHIFLQRRADALTEGLAALRKEVGSLSRTIGGTAEEDAADILEYVMRGRGYTLLGEPSAVDLDGDGELDLLARARGPEGAEVTVLVEAKVRLRAREVRLWGARLADPAFLAALLERGAPGPYLAYAFGIRVYAEARLAAREAGVGVLSSRGEDVPPAGMTA